MIKHQPVTLRDIAKELKLSISTVCKALNKSQKVNTETRKAVINMANKLGYAPNQIAQSLQSSKTHRLGVVVPNLVSNFFAATISGMQDIAAGQGYNLIICQSNESYLKEQKVVQTLMASQVDGLMLSLSCETASYQHLQAVISRGIPLLLFDRVCDAVNTSKVTVDDYDGAYQATRHLIEQGFRRIAHVSGPDHLSISKKRLAGYLHALRTHGIAVQEELICHTNFTKDDVVLRTNAMLDLLDRPDAIFAISDPVATEVMQVVKARGMQIPKDIALVGFTNIPEAALLEPSLTTIAQPAYQMGKIAAIHILNQIQQPTRKLTQSIRLKTKLLVRESSIMPHHQLASQTK